MAEFSKEFDQHVGFGHHNFSILEEFEKLDEGHYISLVCEGFGFRAILKAGGKCTLIFHDENENNVLVDYDMLCAMYDKNELPWQRKTNNTKDELPF